MGSDGGNGVDSPGITPDPEVRVRLPSLLMLVLDPSYETWPKNMTGFEADYEIFTREDLPLGPKFELVGSGALLLDTRRTYSAEYATRYVINIALHANNPAGRVSGGENSESTSSLTTPSA